MTNEFFFVFRFYFKVVLTWRHFCFPQRLNQSGFIILLASTRHAFAAIPGFFFGEVRLQRGTLISRASRC